MSRDASPLPGAGGRLAASVPCDVITGFLGSGKTTLLRHVLEHGLQGRRVAVVMNEVGDIGIDGRTVEVIEGIGAMVELSSGCVCCSIDVLDFLAAYDEVVERVRPDLVLIETTGVAFPEPLLDRLESAGANCDALITVVDACNFERCAAVEAAVVAQVAAADFIVLNKTDLVSAATLTDLEARLQSINPRAARLRSEHGQVPLDVVFATVPAGLRAAARRTPDDAPPPAHARAREPQHQHLHGHGADAIRAFSFSSDRAVDTDRFFAVVAALPEQILRAKGVVVGRQGTPMLFNFVCGRLGVEALPALSGRTRATEAVFIGHDTDTVQRVLLPALHACLQ